MTRTLAAAVFLACMAVNVRRLCPDVFADDSPETLVTCLTLGIGHPPGDPLLMLTGRLALLIPAGGPAFRLNLLSATLAAVLATGGWLMIARRFTSPLSRFAAAAAAIALTVSNPVLAQQAAVAKGAVYGLNLMLLLALTAAVLTERPLLAMLAAGLLIGHHWMTFAAFAPALLGWSIWATLRGNRSRARTIALCMTCLGLGSSLLLTLPIRAAGIPPLNWGNVTTAGRLLAHASRKPFLVTELAPEPASIAAQAVAGTQAILAQLGLPGVLLAVAGTAWLLAGDAARLWVPVTAAGLGLAATSLYLHLPRELYRLLPIFLLPCWLFTWTIALTGAAAMGSARHWLRALLVLLCLAAPVLQRSELARRAVARFTWSPDLGRALLAPLPAGAGLILVSDLDTFPVWEQQIVRGYRPDVAVVNFMLLKHRWYREILIRRGAPTALATATTREAALGVVLRDRRRAWFSAAVPLEGTPRSFHRIPYHLTYRLTPGAADTRFPRAYSYRGFFERNAVRPEPSAMLTCGYTMECLRNLIGSGMPRR